MQKIVFVAHPPERALRTGAPLLCAGCGCCCCCCLHTLGGVAGSLIAGREEHPVLDDNGALVGSGNVAGSAAVLPASSTVTGRYWKTLGVLSLVALIGGVGIFGLMILAFCLPFIQLFASGIVAIMIRSQPAAAWRQLGRLTGFGLLGAIAGTIAMYGMLR